MLCLLARQAHGSSPRVWGTCRIPHETDRSGRFIPTCVGNIFQKSGGTPVVSVHPHVCGEHSIFINSAAEQIGSSPRVWGTWVHPQGAPNELRFIPTCVGNIRRLPDWFCATTVHPHVCGEHVFLVHYFFAADGSSPRVWGTSSRKFQKCGLCRFIPTCVGNIPVAVCHFSRNSVHPHVCGEHKNGVDVAPLQAGSSPRVWGTFHA